MELTEHELRELALFFAKRMDTSLTMLDPADPPRPGDPRAEWFDTLAEAQDTGRLSNLMRRIATVDPDDENLQSACSLLRTPQARLESYALGMALVGGTGVLLLAILGAASVLTASALVEAAPETLAAAPSPDAPVVLARAEQSEPVPTPMAPASPPTEAAVAAPVVAKPPPVLTAHTAPPPAVIPNPPCSDAEGDVVGYWYAGDTAPGIAGETVTVPHAVNVRADYPDVHNNFDARANINCVLQEGDVVRLSRDPILVPADRYWIPLVNGDLVAKS
jgi:hypothetical protein